MDRDDLRFHFLRNALYHTARRRVLEGRARFSNFCVLALGTTSAADALGGFGVSQGLLGLAVAVVAALQFAFDWSGRARTHEFLQRRYYETLADIEAERDLSDADCARFESRMALCAAEEPPTYRALEAFTHNEALDALYGDAAADQRIIVRWYWHAPLAQWCYFNGSNFRTLREHQAMRAQSRWRRFFRGRSEA